MTNGILIYDEIFAHFLIYYRKPFLILWKNLLSKITVFMYRRPILCTLHVAVDFLKFPKIAVVWGGGGSYWDIGHIVGSCTYIITL